MIAMQYKINLPADYDMEIIRKRVRDSGEKTDGFTGLEMKAYLIAEKAKYNNTENQYAPFYLWSKTEGMNQFLLGGPFNNILNSFGWPVVQNWMVLHRHVVKTGERQYALVKTAPIPEFSDFASLCGSEAENFNAWTADASTTAYITAYNPMTWEICRYHMSTDLDTLMKLAAGSLVYDVHHIS